MMLIKDAAKAALGRDPAGMIDLHPQSHYEQHPNSERGRLRNGS
jgi:hypothetical protein